MQRLEVLARLSEMSTRVARAELNIPGLALELQRMLKDLGFAPGAQVALPGMESDVAVSGAARNEEKVLEVFQYWQLQMLRPTAKLTPARRTKVLARMRDGYSVQQMKMAIDGCSNSPHHMGENDQSKPYNDLVLILRSGDKLEDFMLLAGEPDDIEEVAAAMENPKRRLEKQAMKALEDGDLKLYESLQRRLK